MLAVGIVFGIFTILSFFIMVCFALMTKSEPYLITKYMYIDRFWKWMTIFTICLIPAIVFIIMGV